MTQGMDIKCQKDTVDNNIAGTIDGHELTHLAGLYGERRFVGPVDVIPRRSRQKQIPKATKPCMDTSSSSKVLGTSSDTMSSVTAKAKTPSLKVSMRLISWPRL